MLPASEWSKGEESKHFVAAALHGLANAAWFAPAHPHPHSLQVVTANHTKFCSEFAAVHSANAAQMAAEEISLSGK